MSRFRPDGWSELLTRTFEISDFQAGIYVETIAPDLRPAALVIAATLGAGYFLWKRIKKDTATTSSSRFQIFENNRLLLSMLLGWLIAWGSWLFISGNGRYVMPLFVLVGPLLGFFILRLPVRKDWRWLILLSVALIQVLFLHSSSPSKGWSMLKKGWDAPHPFASRQSFLMPFSPDLIITPQSQTMMALMIETPIAEKAKFLSLDFAQSMGSNSPENKSAIKAINEASNPILFDSFAVDFVSDIDSVAKNWHKRSHVLLAQYGLSIDEKSCKNTLSSINVMQIACHLRIGKVEQAPVLKPSPVAEESMQKLQNLCGASLWPFGAQYALQDGSLVRVFRESRYIVLATVDGSLYVRWRQDLNYRMRWNGINEKREWKTMRCSEIIKDK